MDGNWVKAAYSITEFCKRHSISKAFLYLLWRRGEGPKYMLVGNKRLISEEAGLAWRRSTEKASTSDLSTAALSKNPPPPKSDGLFIRELEA